MNIKQFICRREEGNDRSLLFFNFLQITLGAFPWQESERHKIWRHSNKRLDDHAREFNKQYEPRYSNGLKNCGCNFERELGLKFTRRGLRIDVVIGIIWVSWWRFKAPVKPAEKP